MRRADKGRAIIHKLTLPDGCENVIPRRRRRQSLGAALRSKDGEQMPIHVFEVSCPVRGSNLARLAHK